MKQLILFIYLMLSNSLLTAKDSVTSFPEISILGSQERSLHSDIVDQDYRLWISPPIGYESSNKTYPVIYLLDAQWDFTLMISLYGQLRADGDIPNAILVGITWGGESPNFNELRVRDFLPVVKNPKTKVPGSKSFLRFFEEELFPFIDDEYRVNQDRVLIGSSFAGWFTLYTMFERPDLFSGFLATAPTVDIEDGLLLKLTNQFSGRVAKNNTRLYMAIGNRDGNLGGFNRARNFFDDKAFSGLTYKTELFENLSHSSIKGNGNTRGLQFLFKRQPVSVPIAQLEKFVGHYNPVDSDHAAIVSIKDNRLLVSVPEKYEVQLKPASPTLFYNNNYGFDVEFNLNNEPVTMKFIFTSRSQLFERENKQKK